MPSALETLMQQILAQGGAQAPMDPRAMAVPQMAPGPYMPEVGLQDTRGQGGRFDGSLDALAQFLAHSRGPQMGRYASSGDRFLGGLVTGAGKAWSSNRMTADAERQLFGDRQEAEATARTKARDDAFRTARTAAESARKSKAEVLQRRAEQMTTAIRTLQERAAAAADPTSQRNLMQQAARIRQDLEGVLSNPLMASYPREGAIPGAVEPKPRPAKPAPIRGTVEARTPPKAKAVRYSGQARDVYDDSISGMRSKGITSRAMAESYLNEKIGERTRRQNLEALGVNPEDVLSQFP